jgi:peptidoglycan hydrolase CwlO-like protein
MNNRKLIFAAAYVLLAAAFGFAQTTPVKNKIPMAVVNKPNAPAVKSSAAYAEVLLQKTELSAELENLLLDFTETYPKIKELRFEIGLLQKDLDKLLAVSDASKLTLPLGKLLVRKASLATDVFNLQTKYSDEHPDVKRAKRKVEIFEQAIKEILP